MVSSQLSSHSTSCELFMVSVLFIPTHCVCVCDRMLHTDRRTLQNPVRNILDGELLNKYLYLSTMERSELAKKIGTTADIVSFLLSLTCRETQRHGTLNWHVFPCRFWRICWILTESRRTSDFPVSLRLARAHSAAWGVVEWTHLSVSVFNLICFVKCLLFTCPVEYFVCKKRWIKHFSGSGLWPSIYELTRERSPLRDRRGTERGEGQREDRQTEQKERERQMWCSCVFVLCYDLCNGETERVPHVSRGDSAALSIQDDNVVLSFFFNQKCKKWHCDEVFRSLQSDSQVLLSVTTWPQTHRHL